MRITAIELERLRLPLDPPFCPAWDSLPRRHFDSTLVVVRTDEGITGYGSGDTMDGFDGYAGLFIGTDPLRIARHVRTLDQIAVHAGRYWPLEAALWDIAGKACGQPVATLFGGALDKLACYASFARRWWRIPGDLSRPSDLVTVRRIADESATPRASRQLLKSPQSWHRPSGPNVAGGTLLS